jgi:uncharacterized protein YqgV (UPF0045/DUF77 family)
MHVIIDLCVVPLGVGVSVSPQIAACQRVIEASGLEHNMHAYGTKIVYYKIPIRAKRVEGVSIEA